MSELMAGAQEYEGIFGPLGDYQEFLASKAMVTQTYGKDISIDDLHPVLFPFQKALTRWAIHKGRAAVFADTGLGKTLVMAEWARQLGERTLILAPLSVAKQTVALVQKMMGIEIKYVRSGNEINVSRDGELYITNYEMAEHFNPQLFGAVVLDEASILKCMDGKTKQRVIEMFQSTPYRLSCTATPAPNDYIELGNQAEFLGVATGAEMRAMFFVNANKEHTFVTDEGVTWRRKGSNAGGQEWRLKHHAEQPFFRWLASWSISLTKPSDLGYEDDGFILPPLNVNIHRVNVDYVPDGQLFFTGLKGIGDRAAVRKETVEARAEECKKIIEENGAGDQWVVWCGLDREQDMLAKMFGSSCVSVYGSLSSDEKEERIGQWLAGDVSILLSKAKICGFGLNLQCAHKMVFFGLNDSQETWYQCIRREYRFGQQFPVDVHVIVSNVEDEVYQNVMRKDAMATRLRKEMIKHLKTYEQEELMELRPERSTYEPQTEHGKNWTAMLGDSCELLKKIAAESIALSVYSPPFMDLFTYTDTERDLGNSRGADEFFSHYKYIIREVLRVTKSGRLTCVHTSDIPAMQSRDGWIGLKDFPGDVIRAYESEGWLFTGRAFIQKNPQALRDGTMVLTPEGWKPIEKLVLGDSVIGSNGRVTNLIDIPFKGDQRIYEITFDDGAKIECGGQHLWTVRSRNGRPWKTCTTDDMFCKGTKTDGGSWRYQIPVVSPVQFSEQDHVMPIDPLLMGALLSDGSWCGDRSVSITKDWEYVESLPLPYDHIARRYVGSEEAGGRTATYGITCIEWGRNDILVALRTLGLKGARSWEKFIPDLYLWSSELNRRQLLRGLLNGDGKIGNNGAIWYRTTSERLADGIVFLCHSLGGLATKNLVNGNWYNSKEGRKQGRDLWEISIRFNGEWNPFTLRRKAGIWQDGRRQVHRHITNIRLTGENAPCTCISVSADDGLFVADGFVVTHNSQAIRVKSKALLFVQLRKDSSDSRPALVDQVLFFKKPGENAVPIRPVENGEMDNETWIEWAHGIWLGIHESDTLRYHAARGADDEKHVCPLQLGTIERCIKLYSNPGETVLTPFGGIGSEGYVAVKHGRKAVLIELKKEYFNVMVSNLKNLEDEMATPTLFDALEVSA